MNLTAFPSALRARIYDLATGRYIDEKVAILMVSQTGVGKFAHRAGVGPLRRASRPRCRVRHTDRSTEEAACSACNRNVRAQVPTIRACAAADL